MTESPARANPVVVASVLGALIVGGIGGAALTGVWLAGGSSDDSGPSAPLFAVAASKVNPNQNGAAGEMVFTGELTVVNPGRLPIAVSKVTGELSGVTVTGDETPARNIPVAGQNLVSVKVVVPQAQCAAIERDTAFPKPIPLKVTLVGTGTPVTTNLELAGTGWDAHVWERCNAGTAPTTS